MSEPENESSAHQQGVHSGSVASCARTPTLESKSSKMYSSFRLGRFPSFVEEIVVRAESLMDMKKRDIMDDLRAFANLFFSGASPWVQVSQNFLFPSDS
jgi:hypothetical protein